MRVNSRHPRPHSPSGSTGKLVLALQRREFADAIDALAAAQSRVGERQAAIVSFHEAAKILASVPEDSGPTPVPAKTSLALAYYNLGHLHLLDAQQAIESRTTEDAAKKSQEFFELARRIQVERVEGNPADLEAHNSLASTLSELALAHRELKETDGALAVLDEGIRRARPALSPAAANKSFALTLTSLYLNRSLVLRDLGRPREAAEQARQLLTLLPSTDSYVDHLLTTAYQLKQCAVAATMPADREEFIAWSIDALRRAVAAGLRPEELAADDEFHVLRQSPDYLRLVSPSGQGKDESP